MLVRIFRAGVQETLPHPGGDPFQRGRKGKGAWIALLALLLCMPAAAQAGERILVAGPAGRQVFDLPENRFKLSWVHSVERTEWLETFSVDPSGAISLVASEFESAGAGLPGMPNAGEVVRIADGKMRLTGSRLAVGDLQVQLSDISRHYLRAEDRVIDLNAVFGEGIITIRVEKPQRGGTR